MTFMEKELKHVTKMIVSFLRFRTSGHFMIFFIVFSLLFFTQFRDELLYNSWLGFGTRFAQLWSPFGTLFSMLQNCGPATTGYAKGNKLTPFGILWLPFGSHLAPIRLPFGSFSRRFGSLQHMNKIKIRKI